MQDIINFLTLNGFTHNSNAKYNHNFTNSKCCIIYHKGTKGEYNTTKRTEYEYYEIQSEIGSYFTENVIIYHLIGYLTYYGYMDKNYKQLN